jgi:hypothetical protein
MNGLLGIYEHEVTYARFVQGVLKWVFDYLRNTQIVGFLLYLGVTTDNRLLKGIAGVTGFLLFMHIFSYIQTISFRPFHFMASK